MDPPEKPVSRPDGTEFQRLFVRCGGEPVAVPFERLDEILVPQPFTRVPGSGPEVCGLIGLRGRVLTVFDLGAMLGEPPIDTGADYRILVVRAADRVVGLAVAEIVTGVDDRAFSEGGSGSGHQGRRHGELDLDRMIGERLS